MLYNQYMTSKNAKGSSMNNDLGMSFASLVKNNGGVFKSVKQAEFLLSQCDGNVYIACGRTWGAFTNEYHCDQQGVVKVVHHTNNTGFKVTWTRPVAGEVSVQDAKEIKRLKREIKSLEKKLASRDESFAQGQYAGMESTYQNAKAFDTEMLAGYHALLAKFN